MTIPLKKRLIKKAKPKRKRRVKKCSKCGNELGPQEFKSPEEILRDFKEGGNTIFLDPFTNREIEIKTREELKAYLSRLGYKDK